jgi:hypothetical protein
MCEVIHDVVKWLICKLGDKKYDEAHCGRKQVPNNPVVLEFVGKLDILFLKINDTFRGTSER